MILCDYFDHIKYGASTLLNRFADFFGPGVLNLGTGSPTCLTGDFPLVFPATPNMTANVGIGTCYSAGYRVHNDGAATVTLTFAAADPSHPRIDLVQVGPLPITSINIQQGLLQSMGQITVKTGTPAASPSQPTPDANQVALFAVAVAANQTSVTSSNITDLRTLVTFFGFNIATILNNVLLDTGGTMVSGTITNLASPVNTTDAATKAYVDARVQGVQPKAQAQLATTGSNITLSGEQTIDGVLTSSSRVLVKDQANQTQNLIYVTGSGAWTVASDSNTGALLSGAQVFIQQGTLNSGTTWFQSTPPTITYGTSNLVWVEESSISGFLPLAGGTLTGSVNEAKGTDIASAATCSIGAATGNFVRVTGTTTITSFGTVQAGTRRVVEFMGALTLTYNATSLILPGAANITTAAGDVATFISLGSGNWICAAYTKANGQPVVSTSVPSLAAYTNGTFNNGNSVGTPTVSVSFTATGPGVLLAVATIGQEDQNYGANNTAYQFGYLYINGALVNQAYGAYTFTLSGVATLAAGQACSAQVQANNNNASLSLVFIPY